MRGLFITGTDTGVGKTVLAGAIVSALVASGVRVRALKPVITGLDEPSGADWPPDHQLLATASRTRLEQVTLARFGPAVSPHLAAELEERPVDVERLEAGIRKAAEGAELVIVEGVGGLLVPLSASGDVRGLAGALGLPLVIAARPGLGTINHTLLTLEAARVAALKVAGVVLTPWPDEADVIERSNRDTIASRGEVDVAVLPRIESADPELLARAGRSLPVERWLGAR